MKLLGRKQLKRWHIVTVATTLPVLILAALTVFYLNSRTVEAYSTVYGPATSWFSNDGSSRYILEADSNVVNAGNVFIPIYVLTSDDIHKPTVNISTLNLTGGYRGGAGDGACISTGYVTAGNCGSGSCTMNCTLAITSFSYDYAVAGWKGYVYAALTHGYRASGNAQGFNIRAQQTAGANGTLYLGYDHSSGNAFAIMRNRLSSPTMNPYTAYENYSIPFGASCTTSDGNVSVTVYDGDVGASGIQPANMGVSVIDTTTGGTVASGTITSSNGGGNGGTYSLAFWATHGHHYAFNINSVYANNTIQFSVPFDSVNSVATCPAPGGRQTKPSVEVTGGDLNVGQSMSGVESDSDISTYLTVQY